MNKVEKKEALMEHSNNHKKSLEDSDFMVKGN